MTLYIGVFIGFLVGAMAGVTLTAILVAAREERRTIIRRDRGWRNEW